MSAVIDLTDQRFGRLLVICRVESNIKGSARWLCKCDCGNTTVVLGKNLRATVTQSCGCYAKDKIALMGKSNVTHGHTTMHPDAPRTRRYSPEYVSWTQMRVRCADTQNPRYGGANPPVHVCERWKNSFEAFLADVGSRPEGTSLGRYLDTGDYQPSNVIWMTLAEQHAEAIGRTAMLAWRERRSIPPSTLSRWRIGFGIHHARPSLMRTPELVAKEVA